MAGVEVELVPGSFGEHELQQRYGTVRRAQHFYEKQVLDHVNAEMRAFIGGMEMMFVATSDADGEADCSFRAGPAGFVEVLDDRTLRYPEYRGNGVMASLGNLLENGHVGLLFIDFEHDTIGLHVNGSAHVEERAVDPDVVDLTGPSAGPGAERWVVVEVEEAYIHCSKHIPLMAKQDKSIAWGTDDVVRKGGDYFGAAAHAHERHEVSTPSRG